MLLKTLEDHTEDLAILNSFLDNPKIPKDIKSKIMFGIKKIQAGLKAQKEAAYNIEFALKDTGGDFIIHDLRLEINGKVAQIDHLILNRFLQVYVCETKNFSEGVSYNEQLEFTSFYNNKPYAIPSPIEQNNKHINILKLTVEKNGIQLPKRLGFTMPLKFISLILVSNTARITRANTKIDCEIIKNEAFGSVYCTEKQTQVSELFKIVSCETVEDIAKKLVKLHKPIKFNWIDKFGVREYLNNSPIEHAPAVMTKQKIDIVEPLKNETIPTVESEIKNAPKSQVCAICQTPIDNSVAFWCRKNKVKFNNQLLCRENQKT